MNDRPRVLGNRYEVGDLLGRGGMAEVHIGRDTRLGRTVAIKLLRTDLARDATFQARFRREAQSAAALNHPAIVAVYDTGEETVTDSGGGIVPLPYIVMEYVEGRTLREMLRGGKPLDVGLALEITAGVLSALEYSHRAGIVHRDIKPANVMLTPRGDVKVMDFGIARALADASATMTATQAVIGTAQYLSPEQARGETVDARSDLYSAGCLLFELLAARPPFTADSPVAVAYQHVREQPQPPSVYNPAIPESVDRVVLHSLEKDRESRYQTADAFRADLDSIRAGRPVQAYAAAGAAGATTEFIPQSGTRAMSPVARTTAAPGGLLPGGPALAPGLPVNEPDGQWDEPEERGGGGGRKAGYALLFVAVLLVFGLVAYVVAQSVADKGPVAPTTIAVEDVESVQQAQAKATLEGQGLVVTVEEEASDTVDEGLVIRTEPGKGTQVAPGSAITMVVSTGKGSVKVPPLEGSDQTQARVLLKAQGLELGQVTTADSATVDEGRVITSDPAAGKSVESGSVVDIVISTGKVTVKDFTGRPVDEASNALRKLGLSVEVVKAPSDQAEGTVLDQNPKGVSVAQGSTVTLTVAEPQQQLPTQTPTPTEPQTESPSPSPTLTPTDPGTITP